MVQILTKSELNSGEIKKLVHFENVFWIFIFIFELRICFCYEELYLRLVTMYITSAPRTFFTAFLKTLWVLVMTLVFASRICPVRFRFTCLKLQL